MSYELELRREAVRKIVFEVKDIALAMKEARQDQELRSLKLVTPALARAAASAATAAVAASSSRRGAAAAASKARQRPQPLSGPEEQGRQERREGRQGRRELTRRSRATPQE